METNTVRKSHQDVTKANIIAECCSYHDSVRGRLVDGSIKKVQEKFSFVSVRSVSRIRSAYQKGGMVMKFGTNRAGKCGAKSKLDEELTIHYRQIMQEYANSWRRLTIRLLKAELKKRGFTLSTSTIFEHLKLLNAKKVNLRIKPSLAEKQFLEMLIQISTVTSL
jgi:nucleotidyltransferase/DNA polymerase involved in DNA repair